MVMLIAGRSTPRTALAIAIGTLLLTACALIQPPRAPHPGRAGPGDVACTGDVSRAHAALSAVGDPAATAAAHAASAAAMHAYHTCLAQRGRQ